MYGDIFDYTELIEFDGDLLVFGNVTFRKDFFPWRKYQFAKRIRIQFHNMTMIEQTESGMDLQSVKIVLSSAMEVKK
jgi:hypothetical protein